MQNNLRKRIATAVIAAVNLFSWLIPSDLAYNVAQQRHILLGRYTVERFSGLFIILIISLFVINGIWSKKPQTDVEKRLGLFRAVTLTVSIIFSIIAADIMLRVLQQSQYKGTAVFYSRVPDTIQQGVQKDIPTAAFSYPNALPGYPDYVYILTTDKRGFRNKTDLPAYDVVTIGDSFTEGSHVSDDQPWPAVLSRMNGLSVYNLGMSGGNPVSYLEALKRFGLGLQPRTIFCMFCEGNDFRATNFAAAKIKDESSRGWSLRKIFRSSPLRSAILKCFINYLGPIGRYCFAGKDASSPENPLYPVAWLPLTIPNGPAGKHYAFDLKSLLDHYRAASSAELVKSKGWQATFEKIREIKKLCAENGIRLIVAYAPDKPHVLPPLVKDRISAQQLSAFMALKEKNLAPTDELIDTLLSRLDTQETTMKEFCQQESIEFVSLTEPLRQSIIQGTQAYFTYDQHWTPLGHEIVAQVIGDYLKNSKIK